MITGIEQERILMKHLCGVWKPEWAHIWMAELRWKGNPGVFSDSYFVDCREKKLIYMKVQGMKREKRNEELCITLMPDGIRAVHNIEKTAEQTAKPVWWAGISAEEIRKHSRILGDHNTLHTGKDPLAGGFFLFEMIRQHFPGHSFCRIRFYHAVYASENFLVFCEEDKVYVYQKQHLCLIVFWR
jgi:hypothetical protein